MKTKLWKKIRGLVYWTSPLRESQFFDHVCSKDNALRAIWVSRLMRSKPEDRATASPDALCWLLAMLIVLWESQPGQASTKVTTTSGYLGRANLHASFGEARGHQRIAGGVQGSCVGHPKFDKLAGREAQALTGSDNHRTVPT